MEDDGEKGKTHGNRLYLNLSAAHVEGERVSGEGDRCGDADSASAPARHLHAPTKRCENQSLFDAIVISYSDPPSAQTVRVQTVSPSSVAAQASPVQLASPTRVSHARVAHTRWVTHAQQFSPPSGIPTDARLPWQLEFHVISDNALPTRGRPPTSSVHPRPESDATAGRLSRLAIQRTASE